MSGATTPAPAPGDSRTGQVGPFMRALAEIDLRRARPWSALRRAAVTLAVMSLAWRLVGPSAATSAGMAALLIGFLDRRQTARATLRLMSVGTLAMAVTHLVVDSLVGLPLAVVAILVVIAFFEGASLTIHPDAPMVAHFCGTIAATAAVAPPAAGSASASAIAVLIAGAAQTLVTWATARVHPVVREYLIVADELHLVADSLAALARTADIAQPDPVAQRAVDAAARAMTATRRALERSDLESSVLELLTLVLWAGERVRLEAKALSLPRQAGGLTPTLDPEVRNARFRAAATTLDNAAAALRGSGRTRERALGALLDAQPGTDWLRAQHLQAALADLVAGTVSLCQAQPNPMSPGHRPTARTSLRERIRAAFTPGKLSFRLGARIAVAAAAAMGLATGMSLSHASWASNSVLAIFRPDGGATLPRIAQRAIAVSAAALVVVGIAVAAHHDNRWLLASMAIAILVAYWLGPVNYGLFGFLVTITLLMILAATGMDPVMIALARWVDTLVGCAVALVVAFLMPVWRIGSLPGSVAGVASALADWLREIGRAADEPAKPAPVELVGGPEIDLAHVREAGSRVRDLITDTLSMFQVARLEPQSGVPVGALRMVFAEVRLTAQAALAAENLLSRGLLRAQLGGARAIPLTAAAAADVDAVAGTILRSHEQTSEDAGTPEAADLDLGDPHGALAVAVTRAAAARRLAGEIL